MDSHRNPPPPPPNLRHTTTTQILRHTTSLFYSHLLTFVFLSSLLLTFRSNVQSASYYLSSLIDSDPSLQSLLSRLDFSASSHSHHRHHPPFRRRRRAFLHLSRVGTLDDDFFSGDSDFDRSLFHPSARKHVANSTFVILSDFNPDYRFSDSVMDNGISFPKMVKPGVVSFKLVFRKKWIDLNAEDETTPVSSLIWPKRISLRLFAPKSGGYLKTPFFVTRMSRGYWVKHFPLQYLPTSPLVKWRR